MSVDDVARRGSVPDVAPPRFGAGQRWDRTYVQVLVVGDATAALLAVALAYLIRFGEGATRLEASIYGVLALGVMPLTWSMAMSLARAYERRFLGVGSEEFRRVLLAATSVSALVGCVSWAFDLRIARGYVVVALPVATTLTLVQRYTVRKALHRRRAAGLALQRVLVVGNPSSAAALVRQMGGSRYHGLAIIGACIPGGGFHAELDDVDVPVLGGLGSVAGIARVVNADVVAVVTCPELDGPALRQLSWDLEQTSAELVVAPALTEIMEPRVAIRPVCGVPLLHLERPELGGIRRFTKTVLDVGLAGTALVLLAPFLLVLAILVRLDSEGPAFFRQTRVGRRGRPFTMYKFRTMSMDAEARLSQLPRQDAGNDVLFKLRKDPRVTRVGRWMRRYSLDELPQLFNVLLGQMSLVGPRPPLPTEVKRYGERAHRRLLVKPGLTGLWQIRGRSDLDWDESVRLDLRYVDNWSLAFDLFIMCKTLAIVLRGKGAY